jgi:gamma-D-glutamyl-L-lysine dipeptidyl-peptidase
MIDNCALEKVHFCKMIATNITSTWALASLSVSNMRAIPDHASELVSQVMMGTPLKVLEFKDKFYRVETPEGYLGWLDAKGLALFSEEKMEAWKKADRYLFNQISGNAFESPDYQSDIVSDLVLGDLFEGEMSDNGFLKITLPDGRNGYAWQAECISFEEWSSMKPDVNAIISFAKQMMGSPYLWGGASSKAVDCSGFTKLMYYTQGVILARDASQQVRYGEKIEDFSNLELLQPGDLLFFGNSAERPGHVGIHIANGDFIHSSGRVHISSIIPGDPKHDPDRHHVATRRIVNSLNTEGITRVRSHGWYL